MRLRPVFLLALIVASACSSSSSDEAAPLVPDEAGVDAAAPAPDAASPVADAAPDVVDGGVDAGVSRAGDGDYEIGPTYADAPEYGVTGIPKGVVTHFTMSSSASAIYKTDIANGKAFTRDVWLYVPAQYVPGSTVPFIVAQDGGAEVNRLPPVLDAMIKDRRLPVMVAVMINPGPGDGMGSERGLEYDTVSAAYGTFIETEVLPKITADHGIHFTNDPEGRCAMGTSSGAAAAFTMAWFRSDLWHRVVTYSGTFVNQHPDATYPHGAWEYHEHLIPMNPAKPLRVTLEVGENDNGAGTAESTLHNWVLANQRMASVMKAKDYRYRFLFAKGAGHVDQRVVRQTLPEQLAWVWRGYPIN
ncbi:MAG: putative esterase [Labilithrix sp.]|nr:putative esterase [Labilithrix sp.]